MIKSRTNTLAFWVGPVMAVFFTAMLFVTLSIRPNSKDGYVPQILIIALILFSVVQLFILKIVLINTINRTITVTRFVTRKKYVYNFADIDGYGVTLVNPARGPIYRELRLVKDGKTVQKISGQLYSNIDELETALDGIDYLGENTPIWREYAARGKRAGVLVTQTIKVTSTPQLLGPRCILAPVMGYPQLLGPRCILAPVM